MTEEKKTLSLTGTSSGTSGAAKKGTLSLKGTPGQQHITQTLARGQSRGVQIEVRKKRGAGAHAAGDDPAQAASGDGEEHLTNEERDVRLRALQKAKEDEDRRREEEAKRRALEAEEEKLRAEAEVTGSADIWFGANAVDYSGYPDCRPEYMRAFENLANLATKAAVEGRRLRLHTPIIEMSKAEIFRHGIALGLDYALTVSCYQADAEGRACGVCDSCRLRRAGFDGAAVPDPTRYK